MFTGLVETVGKVWRIKRRASSALIAVKAPEFLSQVQPGDSVAVNGVCLTATVVEATIAFDVVTETLARTTLTTLRAGDLVNLEGALKLGDRLGGHLVQGHVDGIGTVRRTERQPGQMLLSVAAPAELISEIVPRGSITVDGVSLTVVSVAAEVFTVALVPYTMERTNLSALSIGRSVNIETDIIGKYVRRFIEGSRSGSVSESFLREHGFA